MKLVRVKAAAGRKALLAACVASAATFGDATPATAATVEIKLVQTPAGETYFDPAGVHIAPGDTVRWVQLSGFHSIAAYHPSNDNHELRIPASAKPWDSGVLLADDPKRAAAFEHVFTVPGVYDYYCTPHEGAGMVGRIVVGTSSGPGGEPFDYFVDKPGTDGWRVVPDAARVAFPSIARILAERRVHASNTDDSTPDARATGIALGGGIRPGRLSKTSPRGQ